MSAREPVAVPLQAPASAGMVLQAATDQPAGSRQGKSNCGFCGRAWFGDVAYCPYCGRPSASDPTATGARAPRLTQALAADVHASTGSSIGEPRQFHAPPGARTDRPGTRWKAGWKPIVAGAAALAVIAIAVEELAATSSDTAGPPAATRAPATATREAPPAPIHRAPEGTTTPPAAEPVVPRAGMEPPPPPPHRSLCSAANEAAGLCNPQ